MLIRPEHIELDLEHIRISCPEPDDWQTPLILAALTPITRADVEMFRFDKPTVNVGNVVNKKSALAAGVGAAAILTSLPFGSAHAQEQAPPSSIGTMPSIIMTGDSITVGSVEAGNLKEAFQFAGINVAGLDYKGSRPLVWDGCDDDTIDEICREISDGIRGLERMQGPLAFADVAVIALGTNTPLERFEGDMERNVRLAHTLSNTDGKAAVIAVPEMFYTDDTYTGSAQTKNDVLRRMSERLKPEGIELVVLPFTQAGIPLSDGIHPSWDRYDDLAQLTVEQVAPLARERFAQNTDVALPTSEEQIAISEINIQNLEVPSDMQPISISPVQLEDATSDSLLGRVIDLPSRIFGDSPASEGKQSIDISTLQGEVSLDDFSLDTPTSVAISDAMKLHDALRPGGWTGEKLLDDIRVDLNDLLPVDPFFVKQELSNTKIDISALKPFANIAERIAVDTDAEINIADAATSIDAAGQVVQPEAPAALFPQVDHLKELNVQTPEGVFDSTGLRDFVVNNFRRPDPGDTRFADGYFRMPDSIPGLPYEFDSAAVDAERFASAGTLSFALNIALKYQELQQKYPDLASVNLKFGDFTSQHKEHQHGGDIDLLLIPNAQAREEMFLYILSLRKPDGSSEIRHIITGDRNLERVGDDYLESMGYEWPHIVLQTDHGATPTGHNHWHISRDGTASTGEYELPQAGVELNDNEAAPTLDPLNPYVPPADPDATAPPIKPGNSSNSSNGGNPLTGINIDELNINWGNLIGDTTNTEEEIDVPEPIEDEISIEDLIGDNQTNTEDPTVVELPDNYTDEGLIAEEPASPVAPVTPEPTAPEVPLPPVNAYGVDGPLLDIFTPEVVKLILPEADPNNIHNYTPIIMRALNEFSLADLQMACYALATINPETSTMAPIEEIGRGNGKEYGFWYGRGFIQLTWESNYRAAGEALGIDLINYPELALEPNNSARIMAWFLKNREGDIRDALNNGDMKRARQIVNGEAAHGLGRFKDSYITCDEIT